MVKWLNSLLRSLGFAFAGIWYVMRTQRNFKIQIVAGLLAVTAGFWFKISSGEWVSLLMVIALVLSMEMVNTAVESIVDLVTEKYHPLAKAAKDVAAGAVLVAAIFALAVGAVIFLPKVLESLGH